MYILKKEFIMTYSEIPEFGISFRIMSVVLSPQYSILAVHPVCSQRNNKLPAQPRGLPRNLLSNDVWNARAVLCF